MSKKEDEFNKLKKEFEQEKAKLQKSDIIHKDIESDQRQRHEHHAEDPPASASSLKQTKTSDLESLKGFTKPLSSIPGVRARERKTPLKKDRLSGFISDLSAFIKADKGLSNEVGLHRIQTMLKGGSKADLEKENQRLDQLAKIKLEEGENLDRLPARLLSDIKLVEKIQELKEKHKLDLTPIERSRIKQARRLKNLIGLTEIPDVIRKYPTKEDPKGGNYLAQPKVVADPGKGEDLSTPGATQVVITPGEELGPSQIREVGRGSQAELKVKKSGIGLPDFIEKPAGVLLGVGQGLAEVMIPNLSPEHETWNLEEGPERQAIQRLREQRLEQSLPERASNEILDFAALPAEIISAVLITDPFDERDPLDQGREFGRGVAPGIAASALEFGNNPLDTLEAFPLTSFFTITPILSAANTLVKAAKGAKATSKGLQGLSNLYEKAILPKLDQFKELVTSNRIPFNFGPKLKEALRYLPNKDRKNVIKQYVDDVLLNPERAFSQRASLANRLALDLEGQGGNLNALLDQINKSLLDIDLPQTIRTVKGNKKVLRSEVDELLADGKDLTIQKEVLSSEFIDKVNSYQIPSKELTKELVDRNHQLKKSHIVGNWQKNRAQLEKLALDMPQQRMLLPGRTTLGIEARKYLDVDPSEGPIMVPSYFNSSIKWYARSQGQAERALLEATLQLQAQVKRQRTVHNIASANNNLISNAFMQFIRRGIPGSTVLTKGIKLGLQYKKWQRGHDYSVSGKDGFFKTMEELGLTDTTLLDADIGTGANLIKDIPVAGPIVDLINKTPIGKFYQGMQDYYKWGDNIFKLEEAWHVSKKVLNAVATLAPNQYIGLPMGKGVKVYISKSPSGAWEITSNRINNPPYTLPDVKKKKSFKESYKEIAEDIEKGKQQPKDRFFLDAPGEGSRADLPTESIPASPGATAKYVPGPYLEGVKGRYTEADIDIGVGSFHRSKPTEEYKGSGEPRGFKEHIEPSRFPIISQPLYPTPLPYKAAKPTEAYIPGSFKKPNATFTDVKRTVFEYGARSAENLFFNYQDVGPHTRRLKSSPLFGLASPYTTWFFKAMDRPGQKGLISRTAEIPGFIETNSTYIASKQMQEAMGLAASRSLLVNNLRGDLLENPDETRRWLSWDFGKPEAMVIRLTSNPLWLETHKAESYNWMAPSNAVLRSFDHIFFSSKPSEEELADLLKMQNNSGKSRLINKYRKKLNKYIRNPYDLGDALELVGLGGGLLSEQLHKLSNTRVHQSKASFAAEISKSFMGVTPTRFLQIGASAISKPGYPDFSGFLYDFSEVNKRWQVPKYINEKQDKEFRRDIFQWSFRSLVGLGFQPRYVGLPDSEDTGMQESEAITEAMGKQSKATPVSKAIDRYKASFRKGFITPLKKRKKHIQYFPDYTEAQKLEQLDNINKLIEFYDDALNEEEGKLKEYWQKQRDLFILRRRKQKGKDIVNKRIKEKERQRPFQGTPGYR
tara:strand:- start:4246 stop:8655 length:4410 start_codon:yes stop_codon:yes gene_type:complete